MLLIIALAYAGSVWLVFFKWKLLPWNSRSRAASIGGGVVTVTGVVIALFQGAPGSTLPISVQSRVIQIQSGVSGRITEIQARPNVPLKQGDKLFTVDPEPYQNEVNRIKAQLSQAESGVQQMQSTLAAAEASVTDAAARLAQAKGVQSRVAGEVGAQIDAARAAVASARETLVVAEADWARNDAQVTASVATAEANLRSAQAKHALAEVEERRAAELLSKQTISKSDYDTHKRNAEVTESQRDGLADALEQTRLSGQQQTDARRGAVSTATSQLAAASANLVAAELSANDRIEGAQTDVESFAAQWTAAKANAAKATEWLSATQDGEQVSVRQVREALATAEFNLGQTTTYAPSDGFVTTLVAAVGSFAHATTVMVFVNTEDVFVVVPIAQNAAKHVRPGDLAEVAIKSYPGSILVGKVTAVGFATGEAQVTPGSLLKADQPLASKNILVKVRLDPDPEHPVEFGMTGSAAIYTGTATPFHIIRKVMIRMDALKSFLF